MIERLLDLMAKPICWWWERSCNKTYEAMKKANPHLEILPYTRHVNPNLEVHDEAR